MTVTWEDLGWERVAAGVGRCRLPVWDCTAGLVVGEDAALVIDPGSSLAEGAKVREQARALAGHRVTHLALTHPHFDHVFGAAALTDVEVFGAVGVDAVLTRVRDREEMRADAVRNGLAAETAEEAAQRLAAPGHLVSGEWTLDLGGGRQVLLANVGPGHTAHDLAVLVPGDPEVVFCGDLVEESGEPQAGRDAVPSQWPAALDRLLGLGGEDAVYVPGHGALVDAAFVRAQRDALAVRFGVSR
ncbi:MBL fold metallo-hydrolase [Streptomyces indiaensis]|uniref:MBL fold metallo-hydrolase n=1 Tax=Streptomyces indiaensis TaxID=284033 RepID=A0ABP5Q573_9ACTN|nr:MBL fold metallo-hydrolase [Streptomyces indiaensis]MCF1646143.1 MBL fold metallo-hydrolase [Streptomyces indiaensis]